MNFKEWEQAREAWLKSLNAKATVAQKKELISLKEIGSFSDFEIIFKVFGWRSPISEEIWNGKTSRGEKMGLNESVYYLLRVVLDIPLHCMPKNLTITDLSKTKLKDLILVGIENGHVQTSGKDLDQSVRAAINEVCKRLKIKPKKVGQIEG